MPVISNQIHILFDPFCAPNRGRVDTVFGWGCALWRDYTRGEVRRARWKEWLKSAQHRPPRPTEWVAVLGRQEPPDRPASRRPTRSAKPSVQDGGIAVPFAEDTAGQVGASSILASESFSADAPKGKGRTLPQMDRRKPRAGNEGPPSSCYSGPT